ncbi:methylmalonyl-CoA epimerase, mitochondrial-like [Argonauta hians]
MALARQVFLRCAAKMIFSPPRRSFQKNCTLLKAWKLGKINHIAIAVADLDKAVSLYKDVLGAKVSSKQDLPEHGVTTAFIELGDTKIELLYPLGKKSPINNFLEKNKNGGMHHICIEVDDIEKAIKDLRSKNIRLLSEKAKIGAHGKPVIFAHPKDCDGVLVEFEQL